MYELKAKEYFEGKDETQIRIQQESPWRDFIIFLKGDKRNERDNLLIELGLAEIAKEANPSIAIDRLDNIVAELKKEIKTAFETLVLSKDLSKEQKDNILNQYKPYQVGKNYEENEKFAYKGKVYETIQAHTSQTTWLPDSTPALYKEYLNVEIKNQDGSTTEVVAEFKQPTGAHDAYKKGDKVLFNGKVYKSKIDANTFSPDQFADGWEEVTE
ncbi:carbohydrate-binding protein [Anaerococcus vaginalis]|uniref:carbohydrate-binding protein n=1 Tax=Anaerococcus vaginalis TaxID=33037 RepID=UPI0028FFF246|nr:carbohydrate-binding protein [Anaerococcus vaginalis]MDU2648309.1 sugar-binding protein [Anaerococcus vaginalis]